MPTEIIETTIVADFEFIIDTASLDELRLRTPVGNDKFSPDVQEKKPGRPSVGVQGMILDAMDDERITRREASALLGRLHARLSGGKAGFSRVTADGDLQPIGMEASDGG